MGRFNILALSVSFLIAFLYVGTGTAQAHDCTIQKTQLWPPNHNLVNVGLKVNVRDPNFQGATINIKVFSDEDDEEQTGDGNHSPDAKDIAPNTLRLRSERKGDAD